MAETTPGGAPPDLVALDLELAAPVRLGRTFLADSVRVGPGVVCAARVRSTLCHHILADRVTLTEATWWLARVGGCGVVTWNGLTFDEPVLDAWLARRLRATPLPLRAAAGWGRHVDLYALAALLDAGVPASELARLGVDSDWQAQWPYDVFRRHRGWRLGLVGAATLNLQKHGLGAAEAPKAWARGDLDVVIEYCRYDVALTRALYLHAWGGGELISGQGRRVSIPRELLC